MNRQDMLSEARALTRTAKLENDYEVYVALHNIRASMTGQNWTQSLDKLLMTMDDELFSDGGPDVPVVLTLQADVPRSTKWSD